MFEVLETIDRLFMIIEYESCGELFHKIVNNGKFSESMSKFYFSQLLSAVSHMVSDNLILICYLLNYIHYYIICSVNVKWKESHEEKCSDF